jgi:hypothetical protein
MNMSDMLDVLHYYMEEDFKVDSAEHAEARDKSRAILYKLIYEKEFKFGQSTGYKNPTASGFEDPIVPVDPLKEPTKSYFPPTDFNPDLVKPFGDNLDAPLER